MGNGASSYLRYFPRRAGEAGVVTYLTYGVTEGVDACLRGLGGRFYNTSPPLFFSTYIVGTALYLPLI